MLPFRRFQLFWEKVCLASNWVPLPTTPIRWLETNTQRPHSHHVLKMLGLYWTEPPDAEQDFVSSLLRPNSTSPKRAPTASWYVSKDSP